MYPQLFEYADIILSCNLSSQVINIGLVRTIPDKFENATLRAKTEQKCSASTLERFRWLFTLKISKYHILRHVDYLREDKLHDKMMSAYSKSCGYKKFSVHTIRIRNNKVAFSNLSGIVWTGPKMPVYKNVTFGLMLYTVD